MSDIKPKMGHFALLFLVLTPAVFSDNILFFFAGGNVSHKISVWPWVLELARRGHNVTFISPHDKTPTAHPNISDLAVLSLGQFMGKVYQVDRFKERDEGREKVFDYPKICAETCKAVVNNRKTDPALRTVFEGKFDLVIVNAIFGECGHFVGKYLKAKTITYNSCTLSTWFYDVYGVSPESAWVPDTFFTYKDIPMPFIDRVYNTLDQLRWIWINKQVGAVMQIAAEPLFEKGKVPTLHELENEASFVFLNAHPSMDFARTLPPMFIDIGGMSTTPSGKELPKNFKDFMDDSEGVILITFGSTVLLNAVSTRHQAMFFHLIHEFPSVKFLMRWSGPMPKFLDSAPKNLMVSEWLPQKEILSHPKLKLFITHGGVSSIQEATYNGVPMIVIPLFADQDYNAYRIQAQEVGLRVEIRGMTDNSLVDVVDKALKDPKYKSNMMKKSAIFKDRPLNPVDTAVFWTEFALRHDDTLDTFRPNNQHLNMFQRRLLDVWLFLVVIFVLAMLLAFFVLKLVFNVIMMVTSFGGEDQKRKHTPIKRRKSRKVE